ncbi:MAG: hypothetical protein V1734_06790 [Nanoarchaeota archaeon]
MKKIILLPIMAIIIMQLAAAAINMEITPKKAEFMEGDMLAFDYTITSSIKQDIRFIPHIICPAAPVGFLEEKTASPNAGVSFRDTYKGAVVESNIGPQECTASITILSPEKKKVEKKLKIQTNPSFAFSLALCEDEACTKKKSSFVKGGTIYLKPISKVLPSVFVIVIFPDKTRQNVPIPGSFTVTQSGKYQIEVSASKRGYKPYKRIFETAVIEQAYTIPYADFSIKAGQAVVRPVFKEAAQMPSKVPAKKASIRSFLSRITGYFMKIS